jgi:hypothetical protein
MFPKTISPSLYLTAAFSLLLGSAMLYVYFLNTAVVHVVMYRDTVDEVQHLRNEIALLEADYIAAQHSIAASMASAEHAAREERRIFVYRDQRANLVVNQ